MIFQSGWVCFEAEVENAYHLHATEMIINPVPVVVKNCVIGLAAFTQFPRRHGLSLARVNIGETVSKPVNYEDMEPLAYNEVSVTFDRYQVSTENSAVYGNMLILTVLVLDDRDELIDLCDLFHVPVTLFPGVKVPEWVRVNIIRPYGVGP